MRRLTQRLLWLLPPALGAGHLVAGHLAAAGAATVYDSGGFESPRFSIGNLHDQDSGVSIWKESTTDPSGVNDSGAGTAAVQSSGGGAGLGAQDVLVTRTQYDDRWAPTFSITPTTLNLVTITWNMLVNQASGPTTNYGPFFGIEANDNTSADRQIGALGVDATTGEVLVYDKTAGGFNITPGDASVTFGQMNQFALTLDYQNSEYAVALNGVTLESGLSFFTSGATHFTDADIAALQAAATASANQAGSAVFDNYLITNTTGALPIVISADQTLSTSTDAGIGTSGAPVEFAGGTLSVGGSFSSARSFTVDPLGGNISGTPSSTLTLTSPLSVASNAALTVNINSVIAGITGGAKLTIGDGTIANTLKLATNSGGSSINSLLINGSSELDIANNHIVIADPGGLADDSTFTSIMGYIQSGAITSTADLPGYAIGLVDGNDHVTGATASTNTIEVAYTLYGDANLDGKVDATDFGIFAPNFGATGFTLGWEGGDFNYDGKVDATDFGLFAPNFGQTDSGTDISLPSADYAALDAFAAANGLLVNVPEPTSTVITVMAGLGFLRRRRR